MEIRYTKNARLLLLTILGAILATLSYLIYVFNPAKLIINEVTSFHPNSILYKLWKDPPFDVFIKFYMFNVTNAEEFLEGTGKLTFNEIGPYVYKERLFHVNSTFNKNGTVSFTPKRYLTFSPEHSVGDPNVDTMLLPNIPLLGIAAAINDQSMVVKLGFSSITAYLGTEQFVNLTVSDFLDGYDDPLVGLANDFIPNWIDFSRFGILQLLMTNDNGSTVATMNINPKENISNNPLLTTEEKMQPYSIQNWNGSPGLQQWGYEILEGNETASQNSRCNMVEGAFMGTLFPPNMEKNTTYYLYRQAFCRTLPIEYINTKTTTDGFEGYVYKMKQDFLATPKENPDNSCYCTRSKCNLKGLGDISPCYYDIPISISQPHFLNANPLLLEEIQGLSPDKIKHDTYIIVHPLLGLPLEGKLRLQINLAMPETQFNSKTRPFNNLVIPVLWVELGIDNLPSDIQLYVKVLYTVLPIAQQLAMYAFALGGVVLIFGSALIILFYPDNPPPKLKSLRVTYSQVPVFSLRQKILKPDVLVRT